jgi:hypothetical protein
MIRNLGYVATNFTIETSTARTCRLANTTPGRLRELIASDLADLERVFAFNIEQGIRLHIEPADPHAFPAHGPDAPFDLMLEAKRKGLVLLWFREQLANGVGKP